MNKGRVRHPSAAACDPASRSVQDPPPLVHQAWEGSRQERDDSTRTQRGRAPFYPSRGDGQLPIPELHSVAVFRGQRAVAAKPVLARIALFLTPSNQ